MPIARDERIARLCAGAGLKAWVVCTSQDWATAPESIEVLDDPLPLISKTSRCKNDSVIYAPLSDVGGVAYDDDAVYIDLKTVAYSKDEDLTEREESRDGRRRGLVRPAAARFGRCEAGKSS